METEENEKKCFGNLVESFNGLAAPAGSDYVKGLNMDRFTDKEKADLVALHINRVTGEMLAIDRMEYCTLDTGQLWERFKSQGLWKNAEELQKLQNMMILREIFRSLTMLKLEINNRLEAKRKNRRKDSPMLKGGITADELSEVLRNLEEDIHLVAAPSTFDDLVKAVLCHDWSTVKDPIHAACMTTVLRDMVDCVKRFNPDFNYANIGRCRLFISRKGNPVSAHDLVTSRCKDRNKTLRIESYFARLRKKH